MDLLTQFHSDDIGRVTYTYDRMSRIQTAADFTYDADGNLTGDPIWLYTWDANNRLATMKKKDNTRFLRFAYDYQGRRVEKLVYDADNGEGTPSTHLKFLYNGMELLVELEKKDGVTSILKTFHWGLDKTDTRGAGGGTEGLLLIHDWSEGKSYFPSYDMNGNVVGLLDDDDGKFAAWYAYDAFGNVTAEGGAWKDDNPMRFATQYTDEETGLVCFGFRYYDPRKGRFLNRDPIGEQGGHNLYRYAGNDPANQWDVWGLISTPITQVTVDPTGQVQVFIPNADPNTGGRWVDVDTVSPGPYHEDAGLSVSTLFSYLQSNGSIPSSASPGDPTIWGRGGSSSGGISGGTGGTVLPCDNLSLRNTAAWFAAQRESFDSYQKATSDRFPCYDCHPGGTQLLRPLHLALADVGSRIAENLEGFRGPLTIASGVGTIGAGVVLTETGIWAPIGVPLILTGTTQVGLGATKTADYWFGGNSANVPTGSFELVGEMTGSQDLRNYGSWVDMGVSAVTPPVWVIFVDSANLAIGKGATPEDGNGP